jgi:hypothetical protein
MLKTIVIFISPLIYALAVMRVTGLVVSDSLTEPVRDRVKVWLDGRRGGLFLAELIECPWCAGMWISMAAAPLVWFWGDIPVMLVSALALALSQVAGMAHHIGR